MNVGLELLSFRQLLDRAVQLARQHYKAIFWPFAVPLAASGALAGISQLRLFAAAGGLSADSASIEWGFFFGILFVALIFYLAASVALTVVAMDAVAGRPIDPKRSWLFVLRPQKFVTLAVVLMISVASLLACLVPALYIWPLFAFVLPAMIEEDLWGPRAIGRGVELGHYSPKGNLGDLPWILSLGVMVAWWLISNGLSLLVQIPLAVVQQLVAMRETISGDTSLEILLWLQVPASMLSGLVQAFCWLFSSFGICLLFWERRRLKEGTDLESAIDRLEQAQIVVETP